MHYKELVQSLEVEGFRKIFIHSDPSGVKYPDHTHSSVTAHIVLEGYITLKTPEGVKNYTKGERFDVPAGEVHSAEIGEEGCKYMIGER